MLFISFDQATSITGYSVFKDRELINYGKLTSSGEDFMRFSIQKEKVYDVIKKYLEIYPDEEIIVTLEEIQLQANTTTFKVLAQLQGVLATMITESFPDVKLEFMFASSWKSFAKIKGAKRAEQKKNAQLYVQDVFKAKATQDETDAILIGWAQCHKIATWGIA